MNRRELYDVWAPPGAVWSAWVKPVLFTQVRPGDGSDEPLPACGAFQLEEGSAIVVDLPGAESIAAGVQLAQIGYRPVPLFNACPGPPSVPSAVNVRPILRAVLAATPILKNLPLPADAPPAFLLDARRRFAEIKLDPGVFDNRSISLPTDFPSANRLIAAGIRRVTLIISPGRDLQSDLAHTLLRWQQAYLPIDRYPEPQPLTIERPSGFRTVFYNLLATWGLRRNPLGGFGGTLPMPSSG